jgi:hypothetical protein
MHSATDAPIRERVAGRFFAIPAACSRIQLAATTKQRRRSVKASFEQIEVQKLAHDAMNCYYISRL